MEKVAIFQESVQMVIICVCVTIYGENWPDIQSLDLPCLVAQ